MKYLWAACILLLALPLTTTAYPPGQLHRLARLAHENRGHSLALARSLDGYTSSLARRQGAEDPGNQDVGAVDFDDEDVESIGKRQFDDYGHMRFGRNTGGAPHKRFDDYGHMRYGK